MPTRLSCKHRRRVTSQARNLFASKGLLLFCLILSVSGCAYFHPYITLQPPTEGAPDLTGPMPDVNQAKEEVQKWQQISEYKRDELTAVRRSLDLLALGLTVGAGTTAVFGVSNNWVVGLGIGAATTYTGSSLFLPNDQAGLYDGASAAFVCILSKAETVLAAASQAKSCLATNEKTLRDNVCEGSEYTEADSALKLADLNFREYIATDQLSAQKIREAARNTAIAANNEIKNRSLRPEAVLNAAKSAIQLGAGFSRSAGAPPKEGAKAFLKGTPCDDGNKNALRSVIENSKKIRTELAAALNSLDSLTSSCVLAVPQTQPLTVSQESISISSKQRFNLHVEGGRTPYFFEWIRQATGVSAEMSGPQTIAIIGADAVSGEGELRVFDSQPISQSKIVSVKTQQAVEQKTGGK